MPTELVAYNGLYLAGWVRQVTIPCFQTFIRIVLPDILSSFRGLEERAENVSSAEFERIGASAVWQHVDGDMSVAAEAAFDAGVAFYQLMTDSRQATVNLLAVGLFHLVEQQLAQITTDALFHGLTPLTDAKLSKIYAWYRDELELDLADFEQWSRIDGELRLIANTVKHAEGTSARELRAIRPTLFEDPVLARYSKASDWMKQVPLSAVNGPLMGDGFYLSDDVLHDYGEVVLGFMDNLACNFAELGNRHLLVLSKR